MLKWILISVPPTVNVPHVHVMVIDRKSKKEFLHFYLQASNTYKTLLFYVCWLVVGFFIDESFDDDLVVYTEIEQKNLCVCARIFLSSSITHCKQVESFKLSISPESEIKLWIFTSRLEVLAFKNEFFAQQSANKTTQKRTNKINSICSLNFFLFLVSLRNEGATA